MEPSVGEDDGYNSGGGHGVSFAEPEGGSGGEEGPGRGRAAMGHSASDGRRGTRRPRSKRAAARHRAAAEAKRVAALHKAREAAWDKNHWIAGSRNNASVRDLR